MTEPISAVPDFEEPHLAAAVEKLSPDQVHALPYGAIQLDPSGQAIFYSDAERRLSGYRKTVLGRDFFLEIAPCMNNANFRGRIDRAIAAGRLDIRFNYLAEQPTGTTDMEVRIQAATGGGCWIFLRRFE
jgi:photoactive yellow protein